MLRISKDTNGKTVQFPGFNMSFVNVNHYSKPNNKIGMFMAPNLKFNSHIIKDNNFHIIFAVDNSGSMSAPIHKFHTRLSICKSAIKETLRFLASIGDEGIKNVYVSIITFCSSATTIVEYQKINSESLGMIIEKVNNVHSEDTTNIGAAIENIEQIVSKYHSDKNIKILLSDGHITQGMDSKTIRQNFSKYFQSTIGIGKETDYDKQLLKEMSCEDEERSCLKSGQMKDHIVDSVFGNVSNMGNNLCIYGNILTSNLNIESKKITSDTLNLNTHVFLTFQNSEPIDFSIQNVSTQSVLDSFKLFGESSDFEEEIFLFSPNYEKSDESCFVHYVYDEETDSYSINGQVVLANENSKSSKMRRLYNIIEQFIELSNVFKKLDLDTPDKTLFTNILDKIDKNLSKIQNMDDSLRYTSYISSVLKEYKSSIEPLLDILNQNNYSYAVYRTASAPVRMCSAQSSRSNFAFMGRLASLNYSNPDGNGEDSDEEANVQDSSFVPVGPPISRNRRFPQTPTKVNKGGDTTPMYNFQPDPVPSTPTNPVSTILNSVSSTTITPVSTPPSFDDFDIPPIPADLP